MKRMMVVALLSVFTVGAALAQETCESKAVDKNGKALAGAAKTSFLKKCKQDACTPKAVGQGRQGAQRRREEQLHDEMREGRIGPRARRHSGKIKEREIIPLRNS